MTTNDGIAFVLVALFLVLLAIFALPSSIGLWALLAALVLFVLGIYRLTRASVHHGHRPVLYAPPRPPVYASQSAPPVTPPYAVPVYSQVQYVPPHSVPPSPPAGMPAATGYSPPPPPPLTDKFCPTCGAGNRRESAFCHKCGQALPSSA